MNPFTRFRQLLADFGLEYFNRYYGTYRGFVVSNEDPEVWGRLKLKVPQIYGDNIRDYWAWPVGMFSGKGIGFYAMPNVGDMVWVRFENGDPDYPIWEYGHWNKTFTAPKEAKSAKQKVFQTTSGLRFVFDDEKELISIWKSEGRVIEINKDGISLGTSGASKHHGVLGEVLEGLLNDQISEFSDSVDEILEYATTQSAAVASLSILAPLAGGYTTLVTKLTELKVKVEELKKKPETIKSKVITLD